MIPIHSRPRRSILALVTLGTLLQPVVPDRVSAQVPPDEDWRQQDTEHFVITFPRHLEGEVVERAAASAERAWTLLSERFVEGPEERVQLLLTDHADVANGFATPVPFNRITIFVSPPMDGTNISHFDDWLELVITHELVHTFHIDLTGTIGGVLRTVFGRVPGSWPVFPSAATPTWFVEGLATYYESRLTGAGRVKGTWHDMVLRTAALEGALGSVDRVSGSSPVWPHGSRPYIYGSAFLQYVSERYGEDVIGDFAEAAAGQWIPFRMNAAAHDAFRSTVAEAWDAWQAEVTGEAEARVSELREWAPLTVSESIEDGGRLAQQPLISPDGATLALARSDGVERTQIRLSRPDGTEPRDLTRLNGVATLSWTPDGDLVYPQLDFTDRYHIESDLYRATPEGRVTRLTHGARLTYADVAPDGRRIAAIREGGGTTELVILDLDSGEIEPVFPGAPDVHWAYPRWSPDGEWIAAVRWQPPAYMDIVLVEPSSGVVVEVTRDRALDTNPTWSPDGRMVMWSSDRSGIPNLYAAPVPTEVASRGRTRRREGGALPSLRQVTNLTGGASHPSVDPAGEWIYFSSYHTDGWHVERIPYRQGDWFEPQPVDPRFDEAAPRGTSAGPTLTPARGYSAGQTLRPYYWSPLVSPAETAITQAGESDNVIDPQVGIQVQGADLVGRHAFALSAQVSVDGDRFTGGAAYQYDGLGNPSLGASLSQTYDAASRSFNVQLSDSSVQEFFLVERERRALLSATFLRRRFRSSTSLGLSGGLIRESLSLQGLDGSEGPTLSSPRPERTFFEGRAVLAASNTQARAFSISREDGVFGSVSGRVRRETDLDSSLRGVLGQDRSFQEIRGEVGAFKALGGPGFSNHVLAIRFSAGAGFGSGANAFHFDAGGAEGSIEGVTGLGLFGGTGLLFPVRGYPEDYRFGRYAWSGSAEYRFPLSLVDRGLGSFPLHIDRVHGSVFFDAGNAWGPELGVAGFDNPRQTSLASVGAELSVITLPFYAGRLTARFGFGYPLQVLTEPRFYVRIGNAF